jgi:hypothetical protein
LSKYLGFIDDYAEFGYRIELKMSNLSSGGANLSRLEPKLS